MQPTINMIRCAHSTTTGGSSPTTFPHDPGKQTRRFQLLLAYTFQASSLTGLSAEDEAVSLLFFFLTCSVRAPAGLQHWEWGNIHGCFTARSIANGTKFDSRYPGGYYWFSILSKHCGWDGMSAMATDNSCCWGLEGFLGKCRYWLFSI
jgi:hypothetical protein